MAGKIVIPEGKTFMQQTVSITFVSARKTSYASDPENYTKDMPHPDTVRLLVDDVMNAQKPPEPMFDVIKSKSIHQYCTKYHVKLSVPVVFEKKLLGYQIIPDPDFKYPLLRFEAYYKGSLVKVHEENLRLEPFGKLTSDETWVRASSYEVVQSCEKEILEFKKTTNKPLIDELNVKSRK